MSTKKQMRYSFITELFVARGQRMPTGIQHGVDATCELGWLEKDLHAASRPKTLHDEEGEFFIFLRNLRFKINRNFYYAIHVSQFCLVLIVDFSQKLALYYE